MENYQPSDGGTLISGQEERKDPIAELAEFHFHVARSSSELDVNILVG